jgi:hypothetical protein
MGEPGPRAAVARGGKPRGRKSIRPPLRLRRSRRSRPSARSRHERPHGSRALNSTLRRRRGGHQTDRTRGSIPRAREKKPRRTQGWLAASGNQRRTALTSSWRSCPCRSKRRRSSKRRINRCEGIAIPRDHTRRRDFRSTRTSRRRDLEPYWSMIADTGGQLSRTLLTPCPPPGGAEGVRRVQAAPPTMIAPISAKASCQPCAGTPIWARPKVA